MRLFHSLPLLLAAHASAKLLLDYKGGEPASELGQVQLEAKFLGDRVGASGDIFVRPTTDALGLPALQYHRDTHFRRAEIRSLADDIQEGRTYYIGYKLRLTNAASGLVIFQWKKEDKFVAPRQNIPFHLEFSDDRTLTLAYTIPGSNGSNRRPVLKVPFSTGSRATDVHSIALGINTANDGTGWVEFYLDGKKLPFFNGSTRLRNIYLFTGKTYPKFGIYRAESQSSFDAFVYRVQVSDTSYAEVEAAADLKGGGSEPDTPGEDVPFPPGTCKRKTPAPVVAAPKNATDSPKKQCKKKRQLPLDALRSEL